MAPATKPSEISKALPIPKSAIPTVAIVDHELPEARDTIEQIIHAATKNIFGLMICKP